MKLLKEYRFDAMISVGLPFTAHWISKALKTKSPGLHWLVDIEDPFCYSKEFFVNNNQLYNWTNRRAERAVFSQAQAITVTLDNAKERYVEIFPEAASKMRVIPPLFNLPLLNPKDLGIEGPVRMAYFGSFYENVRTPMEFLELLQKCFEIEPLLIERLEVHFYGELTGMVMENFRKFPKLAPVFHFHGLVSRQEVAEALQSVDILLNIGNKTDYHLPSKSVDYLMSGKPVISLSYVANDPFSNLFDAYPLFKALHVENHYFGKLNQLASQFLDFILQNRGKKVPRRLLDKLGQPYRVEVIAELYLQLLREGQ